MDFRYEWIRGNRMSGTVVGGNIRCFLKLAGTAYFPDFTDTVILLESLGGRANRIVPLIAQLQQLGAFEHCTGIILGSFTELEQHGEYAIVEEYLVALTQRRSIPIVKTIEIGHEKECKGIVIGSQIVLDR
ncbi:hypothetical protein [Paenibacillus sp. OSY-SE]|uniref:hypothetical protein n=1 Tax=Paenibacillus sp. OSY-SE TaxID=1196323 RepID=UPI0003011C22|nr:hypothetical protein [Paenibacillus sp. OSY-SE]